ncbi:MAG TPA: substrate-binding domain-containing protein [Nocardioides sp.]|uniref:substrate-binding domain-containing protein n=1 Tax=Nocardioides sp. TaxID=35761 RepID=UPI002E31A894|nr:substrate-binding domain-containing protein [Nocardioides sp.]HEX3931055.1 substrate-binding domain-containing protein [Nocardioides sp.]
MATKALLAELSGVARRHHSWDVRFESAAGVEVTRKVRGGVRVDLVVQGEEEMLELDADGVLEPRTLRPLFVSDVVAAVPESAVWSPFDSEQQLREALVGTARVAYSTGPSGKAFLDLLERWGLEQVMEERLVRAAPGTPVGSLLAAGQADLGFQQRSELADLAGIRVLGPLPGTARIRSTFSGALLARAAKPALAREVLGFLGSEEVEGRVVAAGMMLARA